ncbi:GatB/GatE catalytic domain-containing protein [Xylariaceae sp. FL0804]|nr:GatB/GatE catalytic domain-containing protein [Xylariaceae sp. FL0804]
MGPFRPLTLSRYLLQGQLTSRRCLYARDRINRASMPRDSGASASASASASAPVRGLHSHASGAETTESSPSPIHVPLRKRLKEEAQRQKAAGKKKKRNANNQVVEGWELTVGIEIHAQLNTAAKLFSPASTSFNDPPNTHVAYFDLAVPGSMPVLQKATLIPALRAALALGCDVQPVSRFDRKHYFHWDQPAGYQITQFYEPLARDGRVRLLARDGIAAEDGEGLDVGIQQVQMEQDTAKTLAQPGDVHWVDFNRVGVPLVEIITRPEIHHPATAAALVRKVQVLLGAADACVSGMEAGGLRADVNVSVRRSDDPAAPLGTRTEIKNLSSVRAVEDAIVAERDRQIAVLSAGGAVAGETRGWSIGATETRRLRGKEGEVDYRYMPDPDVPPLIVGADLVRHLRDTMGQSPDAEVDELIRDYGLTPKDALSLAALEGGRALEYYWNLVDALRSRLGSPPPDTPAPSPSSSSSPSSPSFSSSEDHSRSSNHAQCFLQAANWVLHELGRLTGPLRSSGSSGGDESESAPRDLGFTAEGECARVPVAHLADIVHLAHGRRVTGRVARELLWAVFRGRVPREYPSVRDAVEREELWFRELSRDEYAELADRAAEGQEDVLRSFVGCEEGDGEGGQGGKKEEKGEREEEVPRRRTPYPAGKLKFLVGRMLRLGQEERIDPMNAEAVMREAIRTKYVPALRARDGA